MLDQDDLKWLAATSTELNSALQQLVRQADLAQRQLGQDNVHFDALRQQIEGAARTSQTLFDRVTQKILARAPQAPAPQRAPVAASPELPPEIKVKNPGGQREFILLIDDEPEIAEYASEMLAEEGYRLITAADGFEALEIVRKTRGQIGLVILDYFLPVMNGDAVFEEIRRLDPSVNVVLSSGFNEQGKLAAMLKQGLRGFIPKPYTREKLLEQVEKAIAASSSVAR